MYIMISSTGDQMNNHRIQNQNSTTEPLVHITHKQCQIN